jgi:hypothetical protein
MASCGGERGGGREVREERRTDMRWQGTQKVESKDAKANKRRAKSQRERERR